MPGRDVLRHNTSSRSLVWTKIDKIVGVRSRNDKIAIFLKLTGFSLMKNDKLSIRHFVSH